jgi:hypothetical protein
LAALQPTAIFTEHQAQPAAQRNTTHGSTAAIAPFRPPVRNNTGIPDGAPLDESCGLMLNSTPTVPAEVATLRWAANST